VRSLLASVSVCGLVLSAALAGQPVHASGGEVQLTLKGDSLDVTVDGQPFTVYHFAKSQKKPYFWPVRSPEGLIMTRQLEKPKDHPHHKGLWFTVDEVNGIKFWAERGKIENVSVDPIVAKGNPAKFKVVNHWLGKDGQPILKETTTITIGANRVIAYDADLTAVKGPVTFGDTKEGMFGFRVANPLRESVGGKVVSAEGVHGAAKSWGKPAEWIDYDGTLDGKLVGVAIFDNPHNFRRSRYHVRDYGLFSISPFGEGAYTEGKTPAAPVVLKPGANLRLRYALYIHDGDTKASDVSGTYQKYLESSGT
jgi:Methane oxygenase PmoA